MQHFSSHYHQHQQTLHAHFAEAALPAFHEHPQASFAALDEHRPASVAHPAACCCPTPLGSDIAQQSPLHPRAAMSAGHYSSQPSSTLSYSGSSFLAPHPRITPASSRAPHTGSLSTSSGILPPHSSKPSPAAVQKPAAWPTPSLPAGVHGSAASLLPLTQAMRREWLNLGLLPRSGPANQASQHAASCAEPACALPPFLPAPQLSSLHDPHPQRQHCMSQLAHARRVMDCMPRPAQPTWCAPSLESLYRHPEQASHMDPDAGSPLPHASSTFSSTTRWSSDDRQWAACIPTAYHPQVRL